MGQESLSLRQLNYLIEDRNGKVVALLTDGLWSALTDNRRKIVNGRRHCWSPRSQDHLFGKSWIEVVTVSENECADRVARAIAKLRQGPVGIGVARSSGASVVHLYQ